MVKLNNLEDIKIEFTADYEIIETKEFLSASKKFFIEVAKATNATTHAQLGDFIDRAIFCVLKVRGSVLKDAESTVVRESKAHAVGLNKDSQYRSTGSLSASSKHD